MKLITIVTILMLRNFLFAAVPTEEGLLKNLNNAGISGNLITIKAMIQNSNQVTEGVAEAEAPKADFYKFVISTENSNFISFFQVAYSNGQMLNAQIKDVKYIPDLLAAIKREKSPEKGLFYAILMMLTTNRSQGMESFLEKNGVQIVPNKNLLNEEKMKLLRSYRTYLASNKGKGEANSPLNPSDAQSKVKVIELFKANSLGRSKNIELVKLENEFLWKADWRMVRGYFTNEERRLRIMEYVTTDMTINLEANDYTLFNGTNEFPKNILFKNSKGQVAKIQILAFDTKTNGEKKLPERFEEAKKSVPETSNGETYSFLF